MESTYVKPGSELAAEILHSDIHELRSKYGERAVRIAQVNRYLVEMSSIPPSLPHPPKYFVSYRWESDEMREWAHQFATALRDCGTRVVLDKWETHQIGEIDIPLLVATIARCNALLAVITPRFNEAVSFLSDDPPTWVTYEFQVACLLAWHGRLEISGILRTGTATPRPWGHWQLLDLREPMDLKAVVHRHYSYSGPIVNEASEAEKLWQECWKLLAASLYADAGRVLVEASRKYPAIPTFWSHLGFCRIQEGKGAEADDAIATALALDKSDRFARGLMAERAYARGEKNLAVEISRSLLHDDPHDFQAHFIIGNILDDEGKYSQARYHLSESLSRRPTNQSALNNAGFVCLHLKEYDEAIAFFERIPKTSPLYLLAQLNKADGLRLKGELKSAAAICSMLLERAPDFKRAQALLTHIEKTQSDEGRRAKDRKAR